MGSQPIGSVEDTIPACCNSLIPIVTVLDPSCRNSGTYVLNTPEFLAILVM
ncbi:hypothetical protein Hanom_Chr03g00252241 [Helianthus anomalus]